MNQIFRINVGAETIQGRLPAFRIGKGYCCRFQISGVEYVAEGVPPKIWITTGTGESATTLFWTGAWSSELGLWVVEVNTDASAVAGVFSYALTVFGAEADKEYIVGQGSFTVYTTIAAGGETGGTAGQSVAVTLADHEARIAAIEAKFEAFAGLATFDPAAFDTDMRNQVLAITNILRGGE